MIQSSNAQNRIEIFADIRSGPSFLEPSDSAGHSVMVVLKEQFFLMILNFGMDEGEDGLSGREKQQFWNLNHLSPSLSRWRRSFIYGRFKP
ncbi:MAG: hypothetical protein PHN90_13120 [Methanothrix sp.]|nr:hypothetical protein [Methanothrix sp.]